MAKAKKHTPEQTVDILRQIEAAVANGKTTPAASRFIASAMQWASWRDSWH